MKRELIGKWVESNPVQNVIITLIIINSITIGMETSTSIMAMYGEYLLLLDRIIITLFVMEILLKIYAFDLQFFKNGWNIFDFIVVLIALVPSSNGLSVLRTLRIFRSFRLLKTIPKLRFIVEALLHSIPSIMWIFVLLIIIFYVFAVIGTFIFGVEFPHFFGSLGKSMYSLFQVMTLESWSMGISRPVMEKFPFAFLYFIPFILIATYTTLNIFIAIVVNTMSEIQQKESADGIKKIEKLVNNERNDVLADLNKIKEQIANLEKKLS